LAVPNWYWIKGSTSAELSAGIATLDERALVGFTTSRPVVSVSRIKPSKSKSSDVIVIAALL